MKQIDVNDEKFAKQCREFNLGRALRSMLDPGANIDSGREFETSRELELRGGKRADGGIIVPLEVFASRDLLVGTPTAGGHTVATNLLANKFIEVLRPVSIVSQLGATSFTGLVGGVAVPRQTASSTAYWVAENGAPTESQQSFDQVAMTPKTVGAFVDISRRMLLQSAIGIDSWVAKDLRASLGMELDRVALNGLGSSNQPLGILQNSNIATTSLGTNGAALTWGNVVDLETAIAGANADGLSVGYVTTKQVRGKLQQTQKVAVSGADMIWEHTDKPVLPGEGRVNGYPAVATTLMPSNLTKGSGTNLSSMIIGNWSDLIIGQWGGGINILLDPYTGSSTGALRIIALADVDVAVRYNESFRKIVDIVTT